MLLRQNKHCVMQEGGLMEDQDKKGYYMAVIIAVLLLIVAFVLRALAS